MSKLIEAQNRLLNDTELLELIKQFNNNPLVSLQNAVKQQYKITSRYYESKAIPPTEAHDKQYWINCEGFNDGKNACTHCCKEIAQTIKAKLEYEFGSVDGYLHASPKELREFWSRYIKGEINK